MANKFGFSHFWKILQTERHSLRLTIALGQLARYEKFLHLILRRHDDVSRNYLGNMQAMQDIFQRERSSDAFTDSEAEILEEGQTLHDQVHLEIESFYLFAKIFLDKTARFIEFYFGSSRKASLDKYSKLVKNFSAYSKEKGLILPPDFMAQTDRLKTFISEHRDKQVAHDRSMTTMHLTTIDSMGRIRIAKNQPGPLRDFSQFDSAPLGDLMEEIDSYAQKITTIVETNSDKSYLKALAAKPRLRLGSISPSVSSEVQNTARKKES